MKMTAIIRRLPTLNHTLLLKFDSYKIVTPCCFYAAKTSSAKGSIMGLGKGKKKMAGKLGAVEKVVIPVESNPERLVNYVCGSNINITGEDIKIKPDSEYPEWLWNLRLGPPPTLDELDPNTKEYWQKVRTAGMRRNLRLSKLRKF